MHLSWQRCLIYVGCCCSCLLRCLGAGPLFVLLLDGLRWDYPLDPDLPNFVRLRGQGASVIPLRPVYPSLCVPNIYSMFTGLYPHHHGLVGNENFDPLLNATFGKASPGLMSHLEAGEPLWDSLAHHGGRSLLYYLPGCSPNVTACARPYQELAPLEEVRTALLEGADAMRAGYADLVVLYVDLLDWSGHHYGPDSVTNRRRLLRQVDVLVGLAMRQVLRDDGDGGIGGGHLLVVGDHGMAPVSELGRATLQQFAMHEDVARVAHVGAAVGVWPVLGRNESLWHMMQLMHDQHPFVEVLTGAQVIKRFYPRSAGQPVTVTGRLPPFSVLPDPGHFMETFDRHYPAYASGPARGWHGYGPDLPAMHTAAMLGGPRALRNASVNATEIGAESLDLYLVMRELLGLPPDQAAATPAIVGPRPVTVAATVASGAGAQELLSSRLLRSLLTSSSAPAPAAVTTDYPAPSAQASRGGSFSAALVLAFALLSLLAASAC